MKERELFITKNEDREKRNTFFGEDIEFFNGIEWKKISDYKKSDSVLTYFLDGKAKLLKPIKYHKVVANELNNIKFRGSIELQISDDALFVATQKYSHELSIFTLKRAYMNNFNLFTTSYLKNTFTYTSNINSMISHDKLRIMIISILLGDIDDVNFCSLETCDKDIIKYVTSYLVSTKIKYKLTHNEDTIILKYKLPRSKQLFMENIFTYSDEELIIMIDELDKHKNKTKLKPKHKDVFDFIQLIYTLYGKGCVNKGDYLNISKNNFLRVTKSEMTHVKKRYKYSFTTISGYIVIRKNGFIMIMGDYKK